MILEKPGGEIMKENKVWVFILAIFAIGFIMQAVFPTKYVAPDNYNQSSDEFKYLKNRMRVEGLSDADATEAANVVMKFQAMQDK